MSERRREIKNDSLLLGLSYWEKFRFMHVTFKYVRCLGGYATRQLRASESGCVHEDVGEVSRIQVGFPFTWVEGYLPPEWE